MIKNFNQFVNEGIQTTIVEGRGIAIKDNEIDIQMYMDIISDIDPNFIYDNCYDLNDPNDVSECLQICLDQNGILDKDISIEKFGSSDNFGTFYKSLSDDGDNFIRKYFNEDPYQFKDICVM